MPLMSDEAETQSVPIQSKKKNSPELSAEQTKIVDQVSQLFPDWRYDVVCDFCLKYNFDLAEIERGARVEFEYVRPQHEQSSAEWQEVKKKDKAKKAGEFRHTDGYYRGGRGGRGAPRGGRGGRGGRGRGRGGRGDFTIAPKPQTPPAESTTPASVENATAQKAQEPSTQVQLHQAAPAPAPAAHSEPVAAAAAPAAPVAATAPVKKTTPPPMKMSYASKLAGKKPEPHAAPAAAPAPAVPQPVAAVAPTAQAAAPAVQSSQSVEVVQAPAVAPTQQPVVPATQTETVSVPTTQLLQQHVVEATQMMSAASLGTSPWGKWQPAMELSQMQESKPVEAVPIVEAQQLGQMNVSAPSTNDQIKRDSAPAKLDPIGPRMRKGKQQWRPKAAAKSEQAHVQAAAPSQSSPVEPHQAPAQESTPVQTTQLVQETLSTSAATSASQPLAASTSSAASAPIQPVELLQQMPAESLAPVAAAVPTQQLTQSPVPDVQAPAPQQEQPQQLQQQQPEPVQQQPAVSSRAVASNISDLISGRDRVILPGHISTFEVPNVTFGWKPVAPMERYPTSSAVASASSSTVVAPSSAFPITQSVPVSIPAPAAAQPQQPSPSTSVLTATLPSVQSPTAPSSLSSAQVPTFAQPLVQQTLPQQPQQQQPQPQVKAEHLETISSQTLAQTATATPKFEVTAGVQNVPSQLSDQAFAAYQQMQQQPVLPASQSQQYNRMFMPQQLAMQQQQPQQPQQMPQPQQQSQSQQQQPQQQAQQAPLLPNGPMQQMGNMPMAPQQYYDEQTATRMGEMYAPEGYDFPQDYYPSMDQAQAYEMDMNQYYSQDQMYYNMRMPPKGRNNMRGQQQGRGRGGRTDKPASPDQLKDQKKAFAGNARTGPQNKPRVPSGVFPQQPKQGPFPAQPQGAFPTQPQPQYPAVAPNKGFAKQPQQPAAPQQQQQQQQQQTPQQSAAFAQAAPFYPYNPQQPYYPPYPVPYYPQSQFPPNFRQPYNPAAFYSGSYFPGHMSPQGFEDAYTQQAEYGVPPQGMAAHAGTDSQSAVSAAPQQQPQPQPQQLPEVPKKPEAARVPFAQPAWGNMNWS